MVAIINNVTTLLALSVTFELNQNCVQILALPLSGCVTSENSLTSLSLNFIFKMNIITNILGGGKG